MTSQVTPAKEAAISVLRKAEAVTASTRSSDPALKPYQPNHRRPVPRAINGTLCGLLTITLRRPTKNTDASAAKPAELWTTMPPAKSSTPHLANRPSALQIMWTKGKYTKISQAVRNRKYALKVTRSANAPVIRAGV